MSKAAVLHVIVERIRVAHRATESKVDIDNNRKQIPGQSIDDAAAEQAELLLKDLLDKFDDLKTLKEKN